MTHGAMERVVNPELAEAIDESFGEFLRRESFSWVPNSVTGWFADRVAIYDGPEYRLVFELDRTNDMSVVAQALDNQQRGGALGFLLPFLSGETGSDLSLRAHAETLSMRHKEVADLLTGRDQKRYTAFLAWVESNWPRLTEKTSATGAL